ncbi:MAG: hypothetical protein IT236_13775 [Bacteroidia bacterium]|nr:hypothetical protein [Bacteroidia bacterium]
MQPRISRYISLFVPLLLLFSCKKPEPIIVEKSVDNDVNKYYGFFDFRVATGMQKNPPYHYNPAFDCQFNKIASAYPHIKQSKIGGYDCSYNESSGYLSGHSLWYSSFEDAKKKVLSFNMSFDSDELGSFSYTEFDTLMPTLTFNIGDTIQLSKSTINTFTILNNPANFTLNAILSEGNLQITKKLDTGTNLLKFYPDELAPFKYASFSLEFVQTKDIVVSGRRYSLSRRIMHYYWLKFVP